MATNFPTNLDDYSNPAPTDDVSVVVHSTQHANHNDAIEALETKVGIDSSAVTTSLDYLVKNTASSNPGHKHTLADGATDITASVTELNYVDGVTSAIQTQLNAKGDVSKVGTPVDNQVGVWTGDGTIEGDVNLTFDTTTDTLITGDVIVTDEAYGAGWNGSTEVPTKNAIYDKIETLGGSGSPGGSDTQVQYNNGGSFGGSANLTWDSNDSLLQVGDGSNVNTIYSLGFSIDKTATPSFIAMDYGMQLYFDGGGGAMLQLGNGFDSADGFYISSENGGELAYLDTSDLSAARTYTFPDQSGTIALTSDIGSGGIVRSIVTTSGSLTLGATASTDYVYYVAGAHTLSMPSPNTNRYTVKNLHSAAITIDTAGAENIEGASSISLEPNDSVDIMSDGTNWYIH